MHDAIQTLGNLRDHLSKNDKPTAFLFGAGTSCSIKVSNESLGTNGESQGKPIIPGVNELTEICKVNVASLGTEYSDAWDLLIQRCQEVNQAPNVENILTRLRLMLRSIGKEDKIAKLDLEQIKKFEETVRTTIAKTVNCDLSQIPDEYPHRIFAQWIGKNISRTFPIEIFTLNYDVLIEHALESERIPIFDGFMGIYEPFFNPESLRREDLAPGISWVRLWKMHGSVSWKRVQINGTSRVVRGKPEDSGELILPSYEKYEESRQQPYSTYTDRIRRFLENDNAILVVLGYSFNDEHINDLIFGALEYNPKSHVYAIQFDEPMEEDQILIRSKKYSNLIVIGPETGVINTARMNWTASEKADSFKHSFILKSNQTEDTPTSEITGNMKIGNFVSFCDFLQSMSTAVG